jgi:hypothetical protein
MGQVVSSDDYSLKVVLWISTLKKHLVAGEACLLILRYATYLKQRRVNNE